MCECVCQVDCEVKHALPKVPSAPHSALSSPFATSPASAHSSQSPYQVVSPSLIGRHPSNKPSPAATHLPASISPAALAMGSADGSVDHAAMYAPLAPVRVARQVLARFDDQTPCTPAFPPRPVSQPPPQPPPAAAAASSADTDNMSSPVRAPVGHPQMATGSPANVQTTRSAMAAAVASLGNRPEHAGAQWADSGMRPAAAATASAHMHTHADYQYPPYQPHQSYQAHPSYQPHAPYPHPHMAAMTPSSPASVPTNPVGPSPGRGGQPFGSAFAPAYPQPVGQPMGPGAGPSGHWVGMPVAPPHLQWQPQPQPAYYVEKGPYYPTAPTLPPAPAGYVQPGYNYSPQQVYYVLPQPGYLTTTPPSSGQQVYPPY